MTALSIVGLAIWLIGYTTVFAMALQTKRLSGGMIALGMLTFVCGLSGIPVSVAADRAIHQDVFNTIADGGDPGPGRARLSMFRVAAGFAIVGALMLAFFSRLSDARGY